MSDPPATYCRLCAEPTPRDELITATEDVGVSSKIITKLEWINIDISQDNPLPNTICFSCFDLLERTYNFLNTVRAAQMELTKIFMPKVNDVESSEVKSDATLNAGKPVNQDWDDFEDTKNVIKTEDTNLLMDFAFTTIDQQDVVVFKNEPLSDIDNDDFDANSSDSDNLPLHLTVKRKRKKKTSLTKLLKKFKSDSKNELGLSSVTWEDYMCRCAQCDAQCKNMAALQVHSLQIHMSCCVFKCTDCGKVINNFKMFIAHVRHLHHKRLRYFCEYCNKQFEMHPLLKPHQKNDHPNMLSCKNCGSNFNSKEELQDHLLIYSKEFKKQRKRETISENKILKCEHCEKEFKTISNLNQHKIVHTERIRNFSCHVCGKMFFTKGTLGTHMATHEETKPFKCEFCPLSFRARGNLLSHASLHTGAKPFVCEQCGRSFRVKRHLKSHSIVHTDLMPYVCEFCNKPFRFKTRLNLHLRQHTGAKPYHCLFCRRDFTNGSNFKKHMKRRHNVDTSKKKYGPSEEIESNGISIDSNGITI